MQGKTINRHVMVLLAAALVAILIYPVMATDASNAKENTDITGTSVFADQQHNIQAFDQDSHTAIPAPYALTEIKGLSIDPSLVNATPYWVYLAAGKKEQKGLIGYIRNSDISQSKKTEWIRFMQEMWKKYPLKFIRKGSSATVTLARPENEYILTKKEDATFAEIDGQITVSMEQTASRGIHPMFAGDQHTDFMTIALLTENYIPYNFKSSAIIAAPEPDYRYSNDEAGKLEHSLNHGYMVLSPTNGLGLAPQNTGIYALAAKADYLTHNYVDAFTQLGYSSHFMGDLGQPFHTPNPVLFTSANWLYYDIGPFSENLATRIQHYEIFHNGYENSVATYWNTNLPTYGNSLSYYANADTKATTIIEPTTSATLNADVSSSEVVPLYYLCEWHYLLNRNFDYMSDPVIAAITIDRVQASVENIRGLVRFVTGGQAPTLTITASTGAHGSISPSGSVSVIYGNSQSFTITPDPGYIIDQILVDNSPATQQNPYPFDNVQSDHTISVTFKKNHASIIPLCPAGTPFDANAYPQDIPQSNPMTFNCDWDGNGKVYISGSPDSLMGVYADDGFTISVQPNGATFDAAEPWAHQHPILELTSGMTPGANTFTLIVQNWMGLSMSYGSSTGIGVDQTPYIIEVNGPVNAATNTPLPAVSIPSFISDTNDGLIVNGTLVRR